jgi:hypothetical protein
MFCRSKIREPINRALLKIVQRPDWKELVTRYVGESDEAPLAERP